MCNCSLGADECDGEYGTFYPLGNGGSCSVRPCEKEKCYPESYSGWNWEDKNKSYWEEDD